MSAPQPRMMLPSGAARCAGSPPGGGSGRPACHTAAPAPIGSRLRPAAARLPRGRAEAAFPRPASPSETPHQTLNQKLRGPSERGPRPGDTHRGRGCTRLRPTGLAALRLVTPPGPRPPSGTAGFPASLERLSPDLNRQMAATKSPPRISRTVQRRTGRYRVPARVTPAGSAAPSLPSPARAFKRERDCPGRKDPLKRLMT